ncbi:PRD domain-containing protein [Corynebacterium phoceense]|uniref:PRD domain-containing protein n=1 Tax=Corynebacterium phoceense TaxID=1686286 RepID=UPI00211CDBF1|nr:PRD domain-containing protein [Corynebacterium phoceense]MCQ9349035.1 PRD domain-containing protein [Corynebacterium phoceense]
MKVVRVLNNNVVLAVDETGAEAILTGWGVGFQAKPGQPVKADKVTRTFRPENERDSDNLAQQLAALDPRFLAAADDALRAEFEERGSATVVALADHLSVAAVRVAATAAQPHPLTAEVKHLYPAEYAAGERILTRVNKQLELDLPQVEAVAIAMHLVNASFHTDGLAETYRMTGVFGQLFDIIDTSFDIELDRQSISAARFITHMRYFFVRVSEGRQLNEGMSVLKDSLQVSHPQAVTCASRLASILELRLGAPLTDDEVSYLALHIARLVGEHHAAQ